VNPHKILELELNILVMLVDLILVLLIKLLNLLTHISMELLDLFHPLLSLLIELGWGRDRNKIKRGA